MAKKLFWFTVALVSTAAITCWLLAQKEKAEMAAEVDADCNYVGNPATMKLHLPTCRVLPGPESSVYYSSRERAVEDGYLPCGICKP